MLLAGQGGVSLMYLTAGGKACYLMLGGDPDEVAPGGGFRERRGSGDGHLKSVFCPERRFHPPELCPPGFFAHKIPSLFPAWGGVFCKIFCLALFYYQLISIRSSSEQM